MKHTFQFARSQNISLVFSDTLYERQRRRRWSVIHRTFSSNLGEEWSTHPPAYQDSWFMRDTFTAWDKQSKRMWKVLVKENKPIHFMFGNCICWNFIQNKLSNLTKIVILQLFSLVSSQMCSLKTTCQNRFKFPYGHCFHICNLYLMETGTQCFKEETSNGERAVAKCLQKFSWHPPCPLKSGRCCIMSCSLSSSWTLDYYLNNCRSARWKRGLRFWLVVIVIIFCPPASLSSIWANAWRSSSFPGYCPL